MASGKVTDFAGEAAAADAAVLRDYAPVKRVALIACLYSTHGLDLEPEAYESRLDVDFTRLEPDQPDRQPQPA